VIAVFTHLTMPRLTVPPPTAGYFKRYLPLQWRASCAAR
jgi:hypothetical protein